MWHARYLKPSSDNWLSRPDVPEKMNFAQCVHHLNLVTDPISYTDQLRFALLGFKSDEGVIRNYGYPGAIDGPDSIREQLSKLPFLRSDIICYDAGDISCFDKNLEGAQSALAEAVSILLKNKIIPILLGGGHEIAWGHYLGIRQAMPRKELTIVNFDAHFDMRRTPNQLSTSGSSFLQIAKAEQEHNMPFSYYCFGIQQASNIAALIATATQHQVRYSFAEDFHLNNALRSQELLHEIVSKRQMLYLTLCLDVFASAYAPGVSAPQPLGLTPWQVMPLVRQLAQSGLVNTYDIAELCPNRDLNRITTRLAAQLIFQIIQHQVSPVW